VQYTESGTEVPPIPKVRFLGHWFSESNFETRHLVFTFSRHCTRWTSPHHTLKCKLSVADIQLYFSPRRSTSGEYKR